MRDSGPGTGCGVPEPAIARFMPRASTSSMSVSIVIRPPCAIASRALTTRLSNTCCICPASAWMRSRLFAGRTISSMSAPIRRFNIFSSSPTIPFRSSSWGASTCWRLNASSCRVRSAARSPARAISSRSIAVGSPSAWRDLARSQNPLITVSRLLKSWAIPAARRPIASIRCDCRSCRSRFRCSVMSRNATTAPSLVPCSSTIGWPLAATTRTDLSLRAMVSSVW